MPKHTMEENARYAAESAKRERDTYTRPNVDPMLEGSKRAVEAARREYERHGSRA